MEASKWQTKQLLLSALLQLAVDRESLHVDPRLAHQWLGFPKRLDRYGNTLLTLEPLE